MVVLLRGFGGPSGEEVIPIPNPAAHFPARIPELLESFPNSLPLYPGR